MCAFETCACTTYIYATTVSALQSPDESAEAIPEDSSSSSPDESSSSDDNDDDGDNKRQMSNKLIQEAKRTSRLSQVASPGEESDGSLEADETSAEAVVQRYMERVGRILWCVLATTINIKLLRFLQFL